MPFSGLKTRAQPAEGGGATARGLGGARGRPERPPLARKFNDQLPPLALRRLPLALRRLFAVPGSQEVVPLGLWALVLPSAKWENPSRLV